MQRTMTIAPITECMEKRGHIEDPKAMFVSAYKRILDENKPKAHPNASINFCFYRPPLPRKSSKQLKSRFPPKRPGPRVPGKRAIFPSLPPLTLSPLLSTPLPCTTSPPPLSLRRLCSGSGVPHPCTAVRRRPGTAPALFPSAGGG